MMMSAGVDAYEPFRQHMQEEAAQELHGIEGDEALLAAMGSSSIILRRWVTVCYLL